MSNTVNGTILIFAKKVKNKFQIIGLQSASQI